MRFGTTSDCPSTGFTTNASFQGLGIAATSVHPAGTTLHLELKLAGERSCRAIGVVAWSMRGMVALQVPGSMGLRITSADETFFQLLQENTAEERKTAVSPAPKPTASAFGRTSPFVSRPEPGRAVISGMPSHARSVTPTVAVPAPPAPRKAFRFPRIDERIDVAFGPLGANAEAGRTAPQIGRPIPLTEMGFTTNVSRSGFALFCKQSLHPGDEVRFKLILPDGKHCEGRGSVIWTKLEKVDGGEQPQMGIHIARVDQTYRDHLQWLGRRVGIAV